MPSLVHQSALVVRWEEDHATIVRMALVGLLDWFDEIIALLTQELDAVDQTIFSILAIDVIAYGGETIEVHLYRQALVEIMCTPLEGASQFVCCKENGYANVANRFMKATGD